VNLLRRVLQWSVLLFGLIPLAGCSGTEMPKRLREDGISENAKVLEQGESDELSGVPSGDRDRIQGPGLVRLEDHYAIPALPPSLHGLRALLVTSIVGKRRHEDSVEQIVEGCRSSALTLFDRIGWWVVRDAAETHDLIVRAECTAAARIIITAASTYVLLPIPAKGMRIESAQGDLVLELKPVARTFSCRNSDPARCIEIVKHYAASDVIAQLIRSRALRKYVRPPVQET
jgi:hypothetical protein